MKRIQIALLMAGLFAPVNVLAQDGLNPQLYSSIAQQLAEFNINGEANASILPSVATENGFGSFIDNPASMGLINISYFNTGLFSNFSEQDNSFFGSSSTFENSSTKLSNMGLIYSVPTNQGSLVVGGGYTLNNRINRTNTIDVYNTRSSITDSFKDEFSDYNDLAFETYAVDFADAIQTSLESIFRIGFAPGEFFGIQQNAEVKQRGTLGEYSIFLASEIQKNLFIGASFGLVYGEYSFDRYFLESDTQNRYDGDFIDVDSQGNGGTDIKDIILEDALDYEVIGAKLRAGLVYKLLPNLNVGASILLPNKLIVTESYESSITTRLDDDRSPFYDDLSGNFKYTIRNPSQINVGLSLEKINGFTVSASTEIKDYRNTKLSLTNNYDDTYSMLELRAQEAVFDSLIASDYKLVANLKAGIKYKSKTGFEIRGGMGFLPGKSSTYTVDKYVVSGGIGLPLSREVFFDVTTQYSAWNDRSILYEYTDSQSGQERFESINETISQFNIMVGIKYRF